MGSDRLYLLAQEALEKIVSRWPADAEPLPERRYVHAGLVASDTEQMVVSVARTFGVVADVGVESYTQQGNDLWYMRAATLDVSILRCAPVVDVEGMDIAVPSEAALNAAAQVVLTDATAILNCLIDAQSARDFVICQGLAFENWTAYGPEGGLMGGTLAVRVSLA